MSSKIIHTSPNDGDDNKDLPWFDLIEMTEGPWKGEIHRSEQMTDEECERRNSRMEVIQWRKQA